MATTRRVRGERRRARRAPAAPVLVLLALGLLGACGSDGGGGEGVAGAGRSATAAPGGSPEPADPVEQGAEFAECLRENGVEVEDPDPRTGQVTGIGSSGAGQETVRKALDACQELAPQGTRETGPPTGEELEAAKELSRCMREEGVEDFPDPGPDGNVTGDVDRTDPKVRAALETCSRQHPAADGDR